VLAVLPRDSTVARAGERVTCIVLEG
jgi:hypothetical protein